MTDHPISVLELYEAIGNGKELETEDGFAKVGWIDLVGVARRLSRRLPEIDGEADAPLEWTRVRDFWQADSRIGRYFVGEIPDHSFVFYCPPRDPIRHRVEGGIPDAKAAAQADYERWVSRRRA